MDNDKWLTICSYVIDIVYSVVLSALLVNWLHLTKYRESFWVLSVVLSVGVVVVDYMMSKKYN